MAFIVFAGQSNTGGAYMDASTLPAAWKADPLTLIWDDQNKVWAQMQPGVNTGFGPMPNAWGPEVQFAIDFRTEHPDEVLRIVKSAEGGTRLAVDPDAWHYDWSPNSADELFDRTAAAIRDAGAAAGGLRPTAVFYGQGEEDANVQAAANAYGQNLQELFAAIRDEWMHDPNGKIGFYWIVGTPPYAAEVRDGEARTDAGDQNAQSFDSRPYPLLSDGIHFSAAAHQMAGDEYFRLYEAWRGDATPQTGGGQSTDGTAGPDVLQGGAAHDHLWGGDGDDRIAGGGEFDDLHGNVGNDTVAGGAGDDWVVGGKGDDGLAGEDGGDIIYGNIGNDWCDGGAGADLIRGGQDSDRLLGADGDDWLSGDRGADTITGGAGADIFHGFQEAGVDRVTDFNLAEGDRVQLDPGTTYTLVQLGADTVLDMGGGHQMILVGVSMSSLTPGWVFGA